MLLLAVAMISAGMPVGTVHAHAEGHLPHTHDHPWTASGDSIEVGDTQTSTDHEGAVFHVHDGGLSTGDVSASMLTGLAMVSPMRLSVRGSVNPPATPPPSSLYRPPIV